MFPLAERTLTVEDRSRQRQRYPGEACASSGWYSGSVADVVVRVVLEDIWRVRCGSGSGSEEKQKRSVRHVSNGSEVKVKSLSRY